MTATTPRPRKSTRQQYMTISTSTLLILAPSIRNLSVKAQIDVILNASSDTRMEWTIKGTN